MKSQNIVFFEQWFEEVWNRQNEAMIEQMLHPACIIHGLGEEVGHGVEGFLPVYHAFLNAFPDIHFTVTELYEIDGRVVMKYNAVGTHLGTFGDFEATGRRIIMEGVGLGKVTDGKLVEAWNDIDLGKIMLQITQSSTM